MSSPRVFIVIPVHDRLSFTRVCISSLLAGPLESHATIVIVDDGSTDGTGEALAREFPEVVVLRGDGSLWWTGAMNVGVAWVLAHAGEDDVVVSLNNDTIPPPGFVDRLLHAHAAAARALIGSLALSAADRKTVVDGGVTIRWATAKYRWKGHGEAWIGTPGTTPDLRPADVLSGCGTLIPVSAFRSLGPYDERHLKHYAADYEFTRRARRAGYGLFVDWASPLYLREAETGLHAAVSGADVRGLMRSFWDIRSANDFRNRWRFAILACPSWAVLTYIPCDYARVIVGSLRRYRTSV